MPLAKFYIDCLLLKLSKLSIQGIKDIFLLKFQHYNDFLLSLCCINKLTDFHYHSTTQILENVAIDSDLAKGRRYFEGSVKFMRTLQEVLDMLIDSVSYVFDQF